MAAGARCDVCGAVDDGSRVICEFCGQAVSAEAVQTALVCPKCDTRNRAGMQTCIKCEARLPLPPPAAPPQQPVPPAAQQASQARPAAQGQTGQLGSSIDHGDPPRMPSY